MMIWQMPNYSAGFRAKSERRKLRLYGCACCRRVWDWYKGPQKKCRELIETAERLADGEITAKAVEPILARVPWRGESDVGQCLTAAARYVASSDIKLACERAPKMIYDAFAYSHSPKSTSKFVDFTYKEKAEQVKLVRDIFGNPFRRVAFDRKWRTSDVKLLAQGIYEERAFDRMPILADALQDAGCDNADILGHCRDANTPHARGCWVVDLILGKS
jgi:hypothetical protein